MFKIINKLFLNKLSKKESIYIRIKRIIMYQNLNAKNIITNNNSNKNINYNSLKYIYDEEFIFCINNLSNSIKNFSQKNKIYLGNIKLIAENVNEQFLFSKSVIYDIMLYFNQITKSVYNKNISLNINEKYIKGKMQTANEIFDKINELKKNMIENIKSSENFFLSFYEEAKNLFKKMKIIRTEKIENLNQNLLNNKNVNNNKNEINNSLLHKHHRAISNSPPNNIYLISNSINNNSKLIKKKFDNNYNIIINKSNEDLNEIKDMKKRYIKLLEENKKLKEDLSKLNEINNSKKINKTNIIYNGTPIKGISSFVKRYKSANQKKYNQKSFSIGNKNNKINILNYETNNQSKNQYKIMRTNSNFTEEDNNNTLKKAKKIKSKLIPYEFNNNEINRDNNKLSISKYSINIIGKSVLINNSINNQNINIYNKNLASMVIVFLREMKKLQENITKKVDNINELKKNFEIRKKQLKKYSENIINEFNNLSNNREYCENIIKEQNNISNFEKCNNYFNHNIKEYEFNISNKEKRVEKNQENIYSENKNLGLDLKNKNASMEIKEAADNINNLGKINNKSKEIQTQLDENDELQENSKKQLKKYNLINKEKEIYKLNENELITIRNENLRIINENRKLEKEISQYKSNLITLSNTNESIIRRKEESIKNLSNNERELNKQIEKLNNEILKYKNNLDQNIILEKEINILRKNNDINQQKIIQLLEENKKLKDILLEIETNNSYPDKDFRNIRLILAELNNKTEQNNKKSIEN